MTLYDFAVVLLLQLPLITKLPSRETFFFILRLNPTREDLSIYIFRSLRIALIFVFLACTHSKVEVLMESAELNFMFYSFLFY